MYGYQGYGKNKVIKEINSIDEILNTNYSLYGSNFLDDCDSFLTKLYSKDEILTSQQVDSLIRKMIKGRSRSLLNYYGYKNIAVLNKLTEKHMLTEKQVGSIISCIKNNTDSFKWIDNLIILGYQLADKQRDKLITLGYKAGIDLILKKGTSCIEELNSICSSVEFNLEKVETFLKKFNIIPAISTVEILIQKLSISATNYYGSYAAQNKQKSDFEFVIKKLIEYKLPPCIEVIEKLYKFIDFYQIPQYIDKLFNTNFINDLSDIAFMFDHQSHLLIPMGNIEYMLTKCEQYKIHLNPKYLKPLMIGINKSAEPTGLYQSIINIKTYTHIKFIYDSQIILEPYYNIIDKFLQVSKGSELELLEHACYVSDRLVFDILINKSIEFTEKCVSNTCASHSINMLKILFNMKGLPNLDCVKSLTGNDNSNVQVFNLLLANGLPINIETIEVAFTKGLYISNLEDYGFKPDLDLYKICYKYNNFPNVYVIQLEKNSSIDMDIRLAIAGGLSTKKTEEEIIDLIKTRNILPDYMMYGQAIINYKHKLVEYFENEWKMKPNLDALVLINDLSYRQQYLKRIIDCHNIKQDIITTFAEPPKQVEIIKNDPITQINGDKFTKKVVVRGKKKEATKSSKNILKKTKKTEPVEYSDNE